MSIAVSAVVRPSRIVLCLTLGMSAGSAAIGILLASNVVCSMLPSVRLLLAAACVFAGVLVACQILRKRCAQRIEISGNGQIRVLPCLASPSNNHASSEQIGNADCLQNLLPSSTLWSHVMILNLGSNEGTKKTLLILPDTLPPTSFRALSVACHWIAAHNNRAERDIK